MEISETTQVISALNGFFGPNPAVWTLFIFFHVVEGVLFMADLIWLYPGGFVPTKTGAMGKKKGKPEMNEHYDFMVKTIG